MSSSQIQKRIKAGLKRAQKKTGSTTADKVYLVSKVTTAGTPLAPGTTTSTNIELVNATFTEYDTNSIDGSIQAGDRKLVSNNDVAIVVNERIIQGSTTYIVIGVDTKAPTSDVLAYISQVRVQ